MKKGTKLLSLLCVLALLLTMAAPVLATEGADPVADTTAVTDTVADTTDTTEPAPEATPEDTQTEGDGTTTPTTPTEGDGTTTTTPSEGEGTTTEPSTPAEGEGTTTTDPANPGEGTTTPPTTDDPAAEGFTKGTEEGSDYWWKLDNGTLTIKGTKMAYWRISVPPMNPWRDSDIQNVVIEDGMTNIGSYAFEGCSCSFTSITIPDSVTDIGQGAFNYLPLTSIIIPDGAGVGSNVFEGCDSLTSVTLPNTTIVITFGTFRDCTSLTSIEIPAGVTSIGSFAFDGCTSLTSIEIPANVTSIGDRAFARCTSLTSIEIPASVTSIGDRVFEGCSSLTQIEVAAENANYSSKNGVLYNKEQNKILLVPHGMTDVYLTGDAPEVAEGAFGSDPKTVYYPENNATYTDEYKQQCGSNLTWVPVEEKEDPIPPAPPAASDSEVSDIVTATPGQIPASVTNAINNVNKALDSGDTAAITTALQAANSEYMIWRGNIKSRPYVTAEATQSLGKALKTVGKEQKIDLGETGSMQIWGTAGVDLTATVTADKERPGVLALDASYGNGNSSSVGTYVSIRLPGVTWNTNVTYGWIADDGQVGHAKVTVQDGNTIIEFYAPHFSRYVIGKATVPTYSTDSGSGSGSGAGSAAILKDTAADADLPLAILFAMGTLLLCGSAVVLKKRA